MPRFKQRYQDVIRPELMKKFGYTNMLQVPRVNKVVLNIGAGEGFAGHQEDPGRAQRPDRDRRPEGRHHAGQEGDLVLQDHRRPPGRREGHAARDQMYEFLDRLITMALPRVRDFRGIKGTSFDGKGNYAMGLKEHIVFVEIDYDKTETVWGMDIIVNTSAKTDAEARALLEGFQFPFVK